MWRLASPSSRRGGERALCAASRCAVQAAVVGRTTSIRAASVGQHSFSSSPATTSAGILTGDLYFPKRFIEQADLEQFDGVKAGKYQIGLGQQELSFAGADEDINSMSMNALKRLLAQDGVDPNQIGFMAVGTETLVDKSKSTKTALLPLLEEAGHNCDIEGVTHINACYGGTSALLQAVDWVRSGEADGRTAVVVTGDIAVYERGPARPTSGAGVVAMLIGENAPIVVEPKLRASYFEDAHDFYKPNLHSEYPVVDGKHSNSCYLRALDQCFERIAAKFDASGLLSEPFGATTPDHALFHLPYTRLVEKSLARLFWVDYKRTGAHADVLGQFKDLSDGEAEVSRDLEKACLTLAAESYQQRTFPSTLAGRRCGNMYAGSLYAGLLSLIAHHGDSLNDTRALMFSYGSGLAATMFSLRFQGSVAHAQAAIDLVNRLDSRVKCTPEEFNAALDSRERFHGANDYSTDPESVHVRPGDYYLAGINHAGVRSYKTL